MGMHLQYVMAMTQWDCFFRSDFEVPRISYFSDKPKAGPTPMLAFLMDEVAPWVMFSSSLSEDQFNKVSEDL